MKKKSKNILKSILATLLAASMLTGSALSSVGAATTTADSAVGASASGDTVASKFGDFSYYRLQTHLLRIQQ